MQQLFLVKVGMAVIFLGILIVIFGSFYDATLFRRASEEKQVKFSFFGLFGFIPVGFSNDRKLFFITMIIGLIFALSIFLIFYANSPK